MARLKQASKLSVVIPTINEAGNLPLLIADLNRWPVSLEICICDGGSKDKSALIAKLTGVKFLECLDANRGYQLHHGAKNTNGDWILFLHADSRLADDWINAVKGVIIEEKDRQKSWFFDFKVNASRIDFRLLELLVNIRSSIFKRPYGDQGLLISRELYERLGGYRPLHIMEDLDLVERISRESILRSLGTTLTTSTRRWRDKSIAIVALKNLKLRFLWRAGINSKQLSNKYYRNN